MTLLQERDAARRERRLQLRSHVRRKLRVALAEVLPGQEVIIFGSLAKAGVFNEQSDIDIALESPAASADLVTLTWQLSERLGRTVDVVFLDRCRFREKILREGERWIG